MNIYEYAIDHRNRPHRSRIRSRNTEFRRDCSAIFEKTMTLTRIPAEHINLVQSHVTTILRIPREK